MGWHGRYVPTSLTITIILRGFFIMGPRGVSFALYDSIVNSFIVVKRRRRGKAMHYSLAKGVCSRAMFTDVLSVFCFHQLVSSRHFPSALGKMAIAPGVMRARGFGFQGIPASVGAPSVELCPLLRSVFKHMSLGVPNVAFASCASGCMVPHFR